MQTSNCTSRWRWYHGLAFYVVVQMLSFSLGKLAQQRVGKNKPRLGESLLGNQDNDKFYNHLRQPVFAPPDWSFAVVWTLNNALCIWGGLRVLNMPKGTSGRSAFLWLQGVVWTSFTAFNALYFGMRSPINGAIDTVVGLLGTIATMYVAIAKLKDQRVVLSQSTILPWLVLAGATATAVAVWNRDECYDAGPFLEPAPALIKE